MREQIYNSNVEIIEQLNKEANGLRPMESTSSQIGLRLNAKVKFYWNLEMLINLETGDNQISMDLSNVVTVG